MKLIFTLSVMLLAGLAAQAQVYKSGLNDKVLLVGVVDTLSPAAADGVFQARISRGANQVALVAARPFTSTYYALFDANNRLLRAGKFAKRLAGDFDIVDLGGRLKKYRIVFSSKPLIAHTSTCDL